MYLHNCAYKFRTSPARICRAHDATVARARARAQSSGIVPDELFMRMCVLLKAVAQLHHDSGSHATASDRGALRRGETFRAIKLIGFLSPKYRAEICTKEKNFILFVFIALCQAENSKICYSFYFWLQ